ncbi:MAG: hypothetical protein Tsb002_06930 [Wenzhouxiangellaceae bacterium]
MSAALLLSVTTAAWAISLEQAVRQVAAQYNGRVISAQTVKQGGKQVHVIRVLTESGKVKTVRIPA